MRKLHRLCRRLLACVALLLVASCAYYLLHQHQQSAAARERAEWAPLPGGPESPDDGCQLRSQRARYAVDRAADPACRRELVRTACAFESGRLPYSSGSGSGGGGELGHLQACPVRLLPGYHGNGSSNSQAEAACHRLLPGCPYPTAAVSRGDGSVDCVGSCRAAGYRFAGVGVVSSSSSSSSCVCLQMLGADCTVDVVDCSSGGGSDLYRVRDTGLDPASVVVSHVAPEFAPEYRTATWENDRVRLVYLLTLSGRGLRQVHRLLSALYYVNHYFYVHVDVRDRYLYESLLPLETRFPNVRLMRRRFPTIWGGTGLLDLMLAALDDLLQAADWHWDYVINLSESDFPIRPDSDLTAYLTEMRHLSFLASHSGNYSDFVRKQAIGRYFVQCDNHMYFLGDREPLAGLLFDGGSDWVTLNREFVQFVVRGLQQPGGLVGSIVQYFKYGLLPVESVFHTIAQNTGLCGAVANANLRLVNWDRKRGCRCQHLPVADWCGCSPMVFTEAAARRAVRAAISASGGGGGSAQFFARKFDPTVSAAAVDAVDEELQLQLDQLHRHQQQLHLRPKHQRGRARYWESLFHWRLDQQLLTGPQLSVGRLLVQLMVMELGSGLCGGGAAELIEPLEVTDYFLEDTYRGPVLSAMVLSRAAAGGSNAASSSVLKLDAHFSLRDGSVSLAVSARFAGGTAPAESVVATRYREFQVGRQYDWKEGIFRDRLGLLTSAGSAADAGLQLRYVWGPGPAVDATFVLLDPDGAIRSAFQLSVAAADGNASAATSAADVVGCTDLQAPGGLRPGVWRLLLLDERRAAAVAQAEFVLLPVLFGKAAGHQQQPPQPLTPGAIEFAAANQLSAGAEVKPDPGSQQYRDLFRAVPPTAVAELRAANAGNDGDSLASLARRLLGRRFALEAVCRHDGASAAAADAVCPGIGGLTDPCSSAEWSTGYPDWRYSLGSMDPLSGYLVR